MGAAESGAVQLEGECGSESGSMSSPSTRDMMINGTNVARTQFVWKEAVTGIETILQEMQGEIDRQHKRIIQLEGQNINHQEQISELKGKKNEKQLRIIELNTCIKQHTEKIDELDGIVNQQQERINELEVENNPQKELLDEIQNNNDEQKRRINELEDTINCPICLSSRRCMVFQCGHSTCEDCGKDIKTCHNCSSPITARTLIFW